MKYVTVWVEIVPKRSTWDPLYLWGAKVGRTYKRRPKVKSPDAHLVEVVLKVPDEVFGQRVHVDL